jgi:hypothetical protein
MLYSFKFFLKENIKLNKRLYAFDRYTRDLKSHHNYEVTHHAEVGPTQIHITYRAYSPNTGGDNRQHYEMDFALNHEHSARHSKVPNEQEHHLALLHHIRKSVDDFTKDYNPKSISFRAVGRKKDKVWNVLAAHFAKKHGGNFKKSPGRNSYQMITFPKVNESLITDIREAKRTTARAEQLLHRISKMKKYKGKPYASARNPKAPVIKSLIPVVSVDDIPDVMLPHEYRKKEGKIEDIPIKDMVSPQRSSTISGILDKLHGTGKKDNRDVETVHHDGKHYLWNGNHRVAAAKLKGETHIKGKVFRK